MDTCKKALGAVFGSKRATSFRSKGSTFEIQTRRRYAGRRYAPPVSRFARNSSGFSLRSKLNTILNRFIVTTTMGCVGSTPPGSEPPPVPTPPAPAIAPPVLASVDPAPPIPKDPVQRQQMIRAILAKYPYCKLCRKDVSMFSPCPMTGESFYHVDVCEWSDAVVADYMRRNYASY